MLIDFKGFRSTTCVQTYGKSFWLNFHRVSLLFPPLYTGSSKDGRLHSSTWEWSSCCGMSTRIRCKSIVTMFVVQVWSLWGLVQHSTHLCSCLCFFVHDILNVAKRIHGQIPTPGCYEWPCMTRLNVCLINEQRLANLICVVVNLN